MSFVFVSHANPDKKKIRHIVAALIAAGEKVWLDNPADPDLGFSQDEIKQYFHRIRAGGRWRDEIDEALRTAGGVLVCWSERVNDADRDVWRAEISYARTEQKLISCRIDDVDIRKLPNAFGEEQMPDLRMDLPPSSSPQGFMTAIRQPREPRPAAELKTVTGLLMQDVRAMLSGRASRPMASRPLRDQFAPYLIDRMDQDSAIGDAIQDVQKAGGVRPFVIAGPENECLDKFLERLRRHTSPQRLRNGSWHQITVEWPMKRHPGEFAAEFARRLACQLGLSDRSDPSAIAKALSERDRPVAVVSLMHADEWELAEPKRIRAWLAWWSALGADTHRICALPILSLTMAPAKPGWKNVPGGMGPGATVSNGQIWRDVQALGAASDRPAVLSWLAQARAPGPMIAAPPVLHPVRKGDAARWVSERFEIMSVERDDAETIIDGIFSPAAAARDGVSLKDFATAVKPLFGGLK